MRLRLGYLSNRKGEGEKGRRGDWEKRRTLDKEVPLPGGGRGGFPEALSK